MDTKTKLILSLVKRGKNVLLHGFGGCGKTFALRQISLELRKQGYNVYNTATTGVASLGLFAREGDILIPASTLHSWAGIGLGKGPVSKLVAKIRKYKTKREAWQSVDVLIIDEISMMGDKLFDKLFDIAKRIRNSSEPFGGIQLIVSGDFLQLPPVKEEWVFTSSKWDQMKFSSVIFDKPKRFDDMKYFDILKRIRVGDQTEDDEEVLRSRYNAYKKLKRLLASYSPEESKLAIRPTVLYSTKRDVYAYNMMELEKLDGPEIIFDAEDAFEVKNEREFREKTYKFILDQAIPDVLSFKVGAQVMLKVNDYYQLGLVNGSRGVVLGFSEITQTVKVRFINGVVIDINKRSWENEDKVTRYTRTQIPLVLAYSGTIHSCQGSTLDFVECDLGSSIFANGQAYVALSRVRNLQGLFISSFTSGCIMTDYEAYEYVEKIEKSQARPPKIVKLTEGQVFVKMVFDSESLGILFASEELFQKHKELEFRFLFEGILTKDVPKFKSIFKVYDRVGSSFIPDYKIKSFPEKLYIKYTERNGWEHETWYTFLDWESNKHLLDELIAKLTRISTCKDDHEHIAPSFLGITSCCACSEFGVSPIPLCEREVSRLMEIETGYMSHCIADGVVDISKLPDDPESGWDYLYKGGFRSLIINEEESHFGDDDQCQSPEKENFTS